MNLLTITCAVLLSIPASVETDTTDLQIEEVTVTAPHRHVSYIVSQSSVEVDADYVTTQMQGSLAKSLESIAGVQASSIGSGLSRPAIRGLGFNRLAIIHDGIRHEGQQWGDDHGLEIDQFAIDNIEIIKGASALLYGSDAVGGAILLSSKSKSSICEEKSISGSTHIFARSNNTLIGVSTQVEGTRKSLHSTSSPHTFYWRLNATYQDYGDYSVPTDSFEYYSYRIPLYKRTLRNTAGREADGSLMLGYNTRHWHTCLRVYETWSQSGFFANAHGLEVRLSDIDYDHSQRDIDLPKQSVNHLKMLWHTAYIHDNWGMEVDAAWQHNLRREESEPVSHGYMPTPPNSMERQFSKHTATINASARWNVAAKHTLRFGLQSEMQHNRRSGWGFIIPDFEQYSVGVYAGEEWRVNSRWTLNAGVRYDFFHTHIHAYNDWYLTPIGNTAIYQERSASLARHFHSFTWSAGVRYTHRGWTFKANIGKAFRTPIAKELGADGINYHIFRYEAGNSALNPEQSYQADLSLAWENDFVRVQADPFVGYFPNYIYLSPTPDYREGLQLYRYTQAQVIRAGAEAILTFRPWRHLDISVQGEYLFARQLSGDKKGYGLPFSPPWRLMPEVKFHWGKESKINNSKSKTIGKGFAAINVRVCGAQRDIVPPEKPTDGWWTLNLSAGQRFVLRTCLLSITLKADNILNTKYYDHTSYYRLIDIPEAGWNLSAMVGVEF
ncbi:MAG: TonB-dependent receptor [Paludibacteraceae bacterium]|nr:TonB-dependent receptor [Paludibacteraceae bacterium]